MADYINPPANKSGLEAEFYPWKIRIHGNVYNPGIGDIHEVLVSLETSAGLVHVKTLDAGMQSDMEATVAWHGGLGFYENDFLIPQARLALRAHFKRTPDGIPPLTPTTPYSQWALNVSLRRYFQIVEVPGQDYPDIVTKVYDGSPDYPSHP